MNFTQWIKENKIIFLGGVTLLFLVSIYMLVFASDQEELAIPTFMTEESTTVMSEELIVIENEMYVDIKGAVKNPGIYLVDASTRVLGVVELAGGFLEEADDKLVNLSERVSDQMVIYIPKEGEEISEQVERVVNQEKIPEGSSDSSLVNLNTGTKEELTTLNGIGDKKAENIINYREINGSFKTVEDLKKVDGIGEKTYESLKDSVCV